MPTSGLVQWDPKKFIAQSSNSRGKRCKDDFSYNSKTNPLFLSISEIRKLISVNKNTFYENKQTGGDCRPRYALFDRF